MKKLLFVLLFLALPAHADQAGWQALSQPGSVGLMRHALAPGTGDPARFRLGDCSTQRNLDDRGREQARSIGRAIRDRGIRVDQVLTSQWCRTRETAQLLGLGEVSDYPAINSFFGDRSTAEAQTRTTRQYLADLPKDTRTILVTHQVNITALTGRGVSSGEIIVVEPGPDGDLTVTGEILITP